MIIHDIVEAVRLAASELPDDGWGLAGLVVIGTPSTVAAVAGLVTLVRSRRDKQENDQKQAQISGQVKAVSDQLTSSAGKVEEIGAQVINGHPDPLRKDLDRYFKEVNTKLTDMQTAAAVEQAKREEAFNGLSDRISGIEQHLRGRRD